MVWPLEIINRLNNEAVEKYESGLKRKTPDEQANEVIPTVLNVRIAFTKLGDLAFDRPLPEDVWLQLIGDDRKSEPYEATHRVTGLGRFYNERYTHGNWLEICQVLMLLHNCSGVGDVWYGSDQARILRPCGPDRVLEIALHYMSDAED